MPEPFSYTRATLDSLKRSVSRIVYILGITISSLSILYYIYAIVIQALGGHWVLFGVYLAITLISSFLLGVYIFKKKIVKGRKRKWGYEVMHATLSWCLIGLRGIVLAFSLYEIFAIGVSELELLLLLFLALLWVIQIIAELLKAFILHYIALFVLAFEKDKATLASDLWAAGKPIVKEKAGDFIKDKLFPWRKKKEEPETKTVEDNDKHQQNLLDELEESVSRFRNRKKKQDDDTPEPVMDDDDEVEPMEIEVVDPNDEK